MRFRCQVGHAFGADILAKEQEGQVDEALRVALRIIEERAELVQRMAADGRRNGRPRLPRCTRRGLRISRICRHDPARRAKVARSSGSQAGGLRVSP